MEIVTGDRRQSFIDPGTGSLDLARELGAAVEWPARAGPAPPAKTICSGRAGMVFMRRYHRSDGHSG
jgi:hypothetical protein